MKLRNLLILSAMLVSTALIGQTPSSTAEKIVQHHITAAEHQNVAEIMLDYADDALLIAPDGIYRGKQAIQGAFENLLNQPAPVMTLTRSVYEGDVGFIVWTMNAGQPDAVQGSDTFIIRDGKIAVQTVAILSPPTPPSAGP
jgi:ketosteroid isomerase-like protein